LTCRTFSNSAPSSSLGKVTQFGFPGYPKQYAEALRTILFGIGQLKESSIALSRIRPPKGVLITGPHGVGKSRLLREIIRQLNGSVNIEELSNEVMLSTYIGDAESELRRVFLSATHRAPSLVIIDDIDLVFKNRSSDASELQKRVVSCLLTLLDGIESSSNVVLLATSSRPNDLDPALRRAGRIDKEIELTIPLASDRYEILKMILQELRIEITTTNCTGVDESQISEKLRELLISRGHGMVASDLLQASKDAALIMLNSKGKLVETDDLIDRMENLDLDNNRHFPVTLDALSTALTMVTPSTIRDIAVEVPQVLWSDIGGMQSLKESLKEVVEWPLRFPHFFDKLNIRPPKGVLLYGPPGCSKTLMAKALATESHMNFLAVRGPELLSKWLGESEKAVQSLFKRARTSAPCIVFFDEIDALATKRGSSSSGVHDRVLSQLLTEIDGIQSKQGSASVIVVAATNRPDMLDPALLRPGRFDRKIYVPPPDVASRAQIVDIYLQKMPISTDIIREEIVTGTEGFSGAEVVAVMTEAAVLAIDEGCSQASQRHFISSIGSIKPQITRDMLNFYDELAKRI
jgi:SpoVK/Ycf46/Vps4 family AAA+-type ATPase